MVFERLYTEEGRGWRVVDVFPEEGQNEGERQKHAEFKMSNRARLMDSDCFSGSSSQSNTDLV